MAITNIPGLERGNFKQLDPVKWRLNWSLFGDTKTGKSSFPLTGAQSPVVVFDLDKRLEGVDAAKLLDEQGLMVTFEVKLPKVDPMSRKKDEMVQKEANVEWDRYLQHYDMTLQSSDLKGGVRRISVDTGTELFDLRLMAEHGRLMGINPRDRGGANAEFTEIMRRPEKYSASVVWLHHCKDEWKNVIDENGREKSMTTGGIVLDGFNKANRIVQIVAKTMFNDKERDPRKQFEVHVVRCGVNSKLNNKKFTSLDWAMYENDRDKESEPYMNYGPLAYISSLAIEGTSPEDWL